MKSLLLSISVAVMLAPSAALSYPNGTMHYVTDNSPFCASCHSAAKAEYMPELPPEMAQRELAANKHYGFIRSPLPPNPYLELTKEQKDRLIKEAKLIDANSKVTVKAPEKVKAGGEITVTVKATGGNGPVICIMLVDRALRFQSRPPSADGWLILGEPVVRGQDGKVRKDWFEKRYKGLKRNLNFIIVTGVSYDPENKVFPKAEVSYGLRAPHEPGTYTLAAAFLYGTENASTAGFFQRPSGRILFSEEVRIKVE